ncbi:immunity protein 72 of polymorphic toxin system [Panacagrimonas perspica]|uniref:Immunity protein 72 of polymorphic toxin system n=1 Tax=Panacagrimonas perspica TaxID=381431 RepID=A0A4S3K5B4_9GAMM|nr:Imm72 family immunity protein [Panacagrimonas perspica]TDU31454.1 immunity protein 72 of polymorphic toxin system [Panacagrimonas perspica]THD03299.1 hypothetical protein B1810_12125 [Panacagrimonas perspica]
MEDDEEPEIIYEAAPTIVELDGNEPGPDAATLAQMGWLLRRYTSRTYIARARDLFAGLIRAFLEWSDADEVLSPEVAKEWALALHQRLASFQRALDALDKGDAARAYPALREAVSGLEPADARDEFRFSLTQLIDAIGPAARPWGESAVAMMDRIERTLEGCWACETILADRLSLRMRPRSFPEKLDALPLPDPRSPKLKTGKKIPVTGIWIATTTLNACPNFLVAGQPAPELRRPCERLDYEATPAAGGEPARDAWSDYEFADEATVWQLVWTDTRYRGAESEDESAMLDEDNALPG